MSKSALLALLLMLAALSVAAPPAYKEVGKHGIFYDRTGTIDEGVQAAIEKVMERLQGREAACALFLVNGGDSVPVREATELAHALWNKNGARTIALGVDIDRRDVHVMISYKTRVDEEEMRKAIDPSEMGDPLAVFQKIAKAIVDAPKKDARGTWVFHEYSLFFSSRWVTTPDDVVARFREIAARLDEHGLRVKFFHTSLLDELPESVWPMAEASNTRNCTGGHYSAFSGANGTPGYTEYEWAPELIDVLFHRSEDPDACREHCPREAAFQGVLKFHRGRTIGDAIRDFFK